MAGISSKQGVKILSIETSCDETSVALLSVKGTQARLLHHEIATQIPIHERYGGVVPEVAARAHVPEMLALLGRAKVLSPKGASRFDAIAVTRGPGLATALRVGVETARTLAYVTGKPLIGVNHLEGHLASAWLMPENRRAWKFPILALLVSGGHTELVVMKDFCSYKIIGRTRDDAAGEAFDKTAKLMGLGYPGGPIISKLAASVGSPDTATDRPVFTLPRPMLHDPSFDFSFSGLKTAVRQAWEALPEAKRKREDIKASMAFAIQEAIVDVLVEKTIRAAQKVKPTAITIVGGVSANRVLVATMQSRVAERLPKVKVLNPAVGLHTDNAAMIAAAGAWRLLKGKKDRWQTIDAKPELDL